MSKTLVELSSSAISKMVKDGYFNKHMVEEKKQTENKELESKKLDEADMVDGVPIQKVPENLKHTAKYRKAARMYKTVPAAQRGTGRAGKRGGDSGFKNVKLGEEVDFTIIEHNAFVIEMGEQLYFEDFLNAAKAIVESNEELVNEEVSIAEQFFSDGDITIILEAFSRDFIKDKVKAAQDAGHKVSTPKFSMKDDKPHAEYVVTDKDSGVRKKHVFHGNVTKHENLGSSE